jgi:hypothetical protein
LLVPLSVGGQVTLDMVLDTGSFPSSISRTAYDVLVGEGIVDATERDSYVLKALTIESQPISDLPVRISQRATDLKIDGILGLSFLGNYTDVHFHVPSLRLTLTNP